MLASLLLAILPLPQDVAQETFARGVLAVINEKGQLDARVRAEPNRAIRMVGELLHQAAASHPPDPWPVGAAASLAGAIERVTGDERERVTVDAYVDGGEDARHAWNELRTLTFRANELGARGQLDEAATHAYAALELVRSARIAAPALEGRQLRLAAKIENDRGDLEESRELLREALAVDEELELALDVVPCITQLVGLFENRVEGLVS